MAKSGYTTFNEGGSAAKDDKIRRYLDGEYGYRQGRLLQYNMATGAQHPSQYGKSLESTARETPYLMEDDYTEAVTGEREMPDDIGVNDAGQRFYRKDGKLVPEVQRGSILPLARDPETGRLMPSMPKILDVAGEMMPSLGAASTIPMRAGEVAFGSGPAKRVYSRMNLPKSQTLLPDLRQMPVDEALKVARREPHLIPSADSAEGAYIGGPRNVKSYRDLQRNRRALDARLGAANPDGGTWYDRYRAGMNEVTGGDPNANKWMSAIEGQWSAGVSPEGELGFSLAETNGRLSGMPVKAGRPGPHAALAEAMANNDPSNKYLYLGKKTGEYAVKINPDLNQTPRVNGVNDFRWGREHGYTETNGSPIGGSLQSTHHPFLDYETALSVDRANKAKLGGRDDWNGEQIQALGWVQQKAGDLQRRGGMTKPPKTKRFGDNGGPPLDDFVPQFKMSDEQAFAEANKTIADFFPKHTAYATHEAQPGAVGHLPGLQQADQAAKDAFAADPRSTWRDPKTGRDMIYGGYKDAQTDGGVAMRVRPSIPTQGLYRNADGVLELNKGEAARPLIGIKSGDPRRVDAGSRAMLDAGESVRAVIDGQAAGAWHKPFLGEKMRESGSVWLPRNGPLTREQASQLAERAKTSGYSDVVDTGNGVTLTDFANTPTGKHTAGQLRKGTLTRDIRDIVPDAGEPMSSHVDGNYLGFEDEWAQGHGSGAATRKMLGQVNTTPEIRQMMDANGDISRKAAGNFERDSELSAKTGDPMRGDLQNLRQIVGSGPGWVTRLEQAVREGKVALPAAMAVLGGAAYQNREPE
jgi:hypothetical protein